MRDLTDHDIDKYRWRHPAVLKRYGTYGDGKGGVFLVASRFSPRHKEMKIVASSGDGWDHVSISLAHRCPTWEEMEQVKRLFFKPDEVAMQLHVAEEAHINCHPYCLHLWRPHEEKIPLPPGWMVG